MAEQGGKLGIVLLAAGMSRRYGPSNKLLRDVNGEPLVRKVAKMLVAADVGKLVVVLGNEAEAVEKALADLDLSLVVNPDFGDGMGTSLAVGVRALMDESLDGIAVCLADLPQLGEDDVRRAAEAFKELSAERIVVPVFDGQRGHPVVFPKRCFDELVKLSGDSGAKSVIASDLFGAVEVPGVSVGCVQDLDTSSG